MRSLVKFSLLAVAVLPIAASAAEAGDAAKGLAYAEKVCAGCHAVQAGAKVSINLKAPPFALIAHTKLVTNREISVWLQSSHPDMPDLLVPPDTRDDLIAYITSLGE
jgi:mono/diheme cytochrome c family protein